MPDEKKHKECPTHDELCAGPDIGDGARLFVRHMPDHSIVGGVMRPVKEGQPIADGCFHLEQIEGNRYKVEELIPSKSGPARVASDAYRSGWERIYGPKPN